MNPTGSLVHAAEITAQSRLHIYRHAFLENAGSTVYVDTDCSAGVIEPWQEMPRVGELLGRMKVEGILSHLHVLAPKTYSKG